MPDRTLFLDIAALTTAHWTGIPAVNRHLAVHLLDHHRSSTLFFAGGQVIDANYVEAAVRHAPGGYLNHFIGTGEAVAGPLHDALRGSGPSVGLFTNVKAFHNVFDTELLVIYDLSPLLMPELHTPETAAHHARGLVKDCRSSDLLCCISEATRDDVELYVGVPRSKTFVAHLAGSDAAGSASDEDGDLQPVDTDAYAVAIGTIEPRKNLGLVAEFLRRRPETCSELAILFVGRMGWGPAARATFAGVIDNPELSDRVAFTGYLPDTAKDKLVRGARFSIYPSLFEGFGLPVLESMAAGVPVIASRSSSIVELGVPDEYLFDPLSLDDFARAFDRVNRLDPDSRQALGTELRQAASAFSWRKFCGTVVEAALKHSGRQPGRQPAVLVTAEYATP